MIENNEITIGLVEKMRHFSDIWEVPRSRTAFVRAKFREYRDSAGGWVQHQEQPTTKMQPTVVAL